MPSVSSVLDTCAGQNSLRKDIGKWEWLGAIRVSEKPQLWRATNQKDEVDGSIMLHARIRETVVRVVLGIFKNIAEPILPGTYFFDMCITGIFAAEKG